MLTVTKKKVAKHTKVNECERVQWQAQVSIFNKRQHCMQNWNQEKKGFIVFMIVFLAVCWHVPWRKTHCLISFFSFWSCTCQEVQEAASNFALVTNVNTYLKLLIRAPASCLDTRFLLLIWQPIYYSLNDRNLIKQTPSCRKQSNCGHAKLCHRLKCI